ncbi:MAG: TadE family protein [Chloroflexota bacterium]
MISWPPLTEHARSSRGQATLEFGIVAIILFTMIFGVIEGGRMLFTYHQLTNASREGARYAIAHGVASENQVSAGSYQDMVEHITSRTTGLSEDQLTVDATWPGDTRNPQQCPTGSNNAGCPVRVTVDYSFEPVVAMFAGLGSIDMSSSSEMRIHY